jgi:nitroreductase
MTVLDAVNRRHSHSKVSLDAPSHAELLPLVAAAATVADHGSLRPWRLIELRGEARDRLGTALGEANGGDYSKFIAKANRASLLIAVVFSPKPSHKVADWEQEAVASGVAHTLSLLLDDAGWGVFWRSGHLTRSKPVHAMHELTHHEQLLGWLYVGGRPPFGKPESKNRLDPGQFLSAL